MKHSALDVANWFLAWAESQDAELSNLKLQKLLYYAQGHFLAQNGEPLFDDEIQAWAHGPVVPEVYRTFKSGGSNALDPNQFLDASFNWDNYRDVEQHLMQVWNTYGHFAAWALRERTHRETPWVESFQDGILNLEIDRSKMRSFFSSNNGA